MSSFTLSNHLLLGLPLFLLPCTFISIALLPTQCSSLLITYPYHFTLISWTFLVSFVTPHIHRSILISATSNLVSCDFFNAHVSAPYISAGLTTVLYTFPLIFMFILLSHNTPVTLFQFFHPLCTRWVTSASSSPSSAKVDPRYVNVCTLFTASPCKWISVSWCSLHPKYRLLPSNRQHLRL